MILEDYIIKRFEKVGYQRTQLTVPNELVVYHLVRWLYTKYGVYIKLTFCSMKFPTHGKGPSPYKRFWGGYIIKLKDEYPHDQTTAKTFVDPHNATIEALRMLSKHVPHNPHFKPIKK